MGDDWVFNSSTKSKKKGKKKRKDLNVKKSSQPTTFGGSSWAKPIEDEKLEENNSKESNNQYRVHSVQDFRSRMHSMSKLMEEYGEYTPLDKSAEDRAKDAFARKKTVDNKEDTIQTESKSKGVLVPDNNTAPIQILLMSFGYKYGNAATAGWSRSNPLPSLDCRELPRASHKTARLSGLSHHVKRELTKAELNRLADRFAEDIFETIYDSIEDGYGYAKPLKATVYAGSVYGRHRSVVLCEVSAQKLRNLLRKNEGGRIKISCSVGTKHRDIDRDHKDDEAYGKDLRRLANYEKKQRDTNANKQWRNEDNDSDGEW